MRILAVFLTQGENLLSAYNVGKEVEESSHVKLLPCWIWIDPDFLLAPLHKTARKENCEVSFYRVDPISYSDLRILRCPSRQFTMTSLRWKRRLLENSTTLLVLLCFVVFHMPPWHSVGHIAELCIFLTLLLMLRSLDRGACREMGQSWYPEGQMMQRLGTMNSGVWIWILPSPVTFCSILSIERRQDYYLSCSGFTGMSVSSILSIKLWYPCTINRTNNHRCEIEQGGL